MKFITVQNGSLQALDPTITSPAIGRNGRESFYFGTQELDTLLPPGGLPRGAVHELLHENGNFPLFFAAFLVQSALKQEAEDPSKAPREVVWTDPTGCLYPPAIQQLGLDLSRLYILHPRSEEDELAMIGECMVCQAVGAVVAPCGRLTQVQARRLQLAAEKGGGVGILIRPAGKVSSIYAAATRWLITPAAGERAIQRWKVELVQGHGGQLGKAVYLEYCRETHTVHSSSQLARRPLPAKKVAIA